MWHVLLILVGGCQLSDAVSLICYNGTINNYQRTNLSNAESLLQSSCIDASLPTLFYVFGFTDTASSNETQSVMKACLDDSTKRNCVLLDWEDKNGHSNSDSIIETGLLPTTYATEAVPNSVLIGEDMGKVLIKMSDYGLNLTRVMLVGHSLGAHLWGYAGREVRKNGKDISIIVGLDPAGPLYNDDTVYHPLNATSAEFVYCVHTDPGVYGIILPYCTVDIWANLNHFQLLGDHLQPGCSNDICNHNRAIDLFKYSMVMNKTSLEASRADNYYDWARANGSAAETIYIGDLVNTGATPGNYYLTTNPPPNFGKGEDGLRP